MFYSSRVFYDEAWKKQSAHRSLVFDSMPPRCAGTMGTAASIISVAHGSQDDMYMVAFGGLSRE